MRISFVPTYRVHWLLLFRYIRTDRQDILKLQQASEPHRKPSEQQRRLVRHRRKKSLQTSKAPHPASDPDWKWRRLTWTERIYQTVDWCIDSVFIFLISGISVVTWSTHDIILFKSKSFYCLYAGWRPSSFSSPLGLLISFIQQIFLSAHGFHDCCFPGPACFTSGGPNIISVDTSLCTITCRSNITKDSLVDFSDASICLCKFILCCHPKDWSPRFDWRLLISHTLSSLALKCRPDRGYLGHY